MDPPELDRCIGLRAYGSRFEGIGGRIRVEIDEFHVEELIDKCVLEGVKPKPDHEHRYLLIKIRKKGVDTIHALKFVERIFGARFRVLGLKDASSISVQYAASKRRDLCVGWADLPSWLSIECLGYIDLSLIHI